MKITTRGIILALKNLGAYLASFSIAGIRTDPFQFAYGLLIYFLVTVPSDLLLLNHWSNSDKKGR